ncbi:hypothetical protein GGS23DRAFT_421503 [Durotheca rogersii]|uniref:uncharacterized protein n=1 Tax=Durotheca rogersii TaxID=419775 RepID=UPI002220C3F6|nr:uncharacterized protein GGS23DRAFT_421503 [Durotheca rogersii]KAI5865317.1 hypothetical protein GGS23DRAFT_421503 [Durotheca rogersii]
MRYLLQGLLAVAYASSSSMALSTSSSRHRQQPRANIENVVLADCTGISDSSQLSSEVAYYTGAPDDTPDDISQVTSDQHLDWANKTTVAYFSNTGVSFISTLRPASTAGAYAGTGNNGYGNFTCWQMEPTLLYSRDDKNCVMRYDCNHMNAPTQPTGTFTAAGGPAAAATSSDAAAVASNSSASGLSTGAIVGLSIGVAAAVIGFVGIAAFLVWRRRRAQRRSDEVAAAAAAVATEKKAPDAGGGTPDSPLSAARADHVFYELHGEYQPAEIHGDALTGELDAPAAQLELHNQDLPPRYEARTEEDHVRPGAYGAYKGPI